MRGTVRPISLPRKVIIDTMHASVPLNVVRRTMQLERLVTARAALAERPGWSTLLAKAFSIVARDEPWFRTLYLPWPWPHFYELPKSVAMIAVIHDDYDKDAPTVVKINAADELSLAQVEANIKRGKNAPLDGLPQVKRILAIARLPLPLRRLIWFVSFNIGRMRANNSGTFGITTLATAGVEHVVLRSPGPNVISYGLMRGDHTMELLFHWDHRIYDGLLAARALVRLEEVLNGAIADELLATGAPRQA